MKVILLAGGFGTRLSEYTETIPKPMVQIGDKPILWHIMNLYAQYNHNDFFVATGYKNEVIKKYFSKIPKKWNVNLIDTGKNTMTGGRVKRLQKVIGKETCMLTYGDGLADINLDSLLAFHKSHGKMVTITAVHPGARFGELEIQGEQVSSFQEKPQTGQGWINGGYFVIEPEFFKLIHDDKTILEQEPLERVAQMGELMAFRHEGFWQCMDTKRDNDLLEDYWQAGNAPWKR